jgi:hypothetical protein
MKPAASLQKVSIRRAPRLSATTNNAVAHASPVVQRFHRDNESSSPIIEVRAETTQQLPTKTFPSAQPRSTETVGASTAGHPAVAPSAIIDLWEHLATDRLRPKISDIDPVTIAGQWPNSLLLRVTQGGRRPGLEVAHMFAPPAGGPTSAIPIDAMTVDWIVSLGREVVITGGPVHETDALPTTEGPISCGVIALPFGPEGGVDHVLCHLYRVDDLVVEGQIDAPVNMPPRDRTGIKRLFGR